MSGTFNLYFLLSICISGFLIAAISFCVQIFTWAFVLSTEVLHRLSLWSMSSFGCVKTHTSGQVLLLMHMPFTFRHASALTQVKTEAIVLMCNIRMTELFKLVRFRIVWFHCKSKIRAILSKHQQTRFTNFRGFTFHHTPL